MPDDGALHDDLVVVLARKRDGVPELVLDFAFEIPTDEPRFAGFTNTGIAERIPRRLVRATLP